MNNYGTYLDKALLDQLIWGVRSESIEKKLLSETNLTLANAMELAQAIEAADQNVKAMKGTEAAVQKLTVSSKHRSPCYRCGKSNHDAKDCRFRNANCNWCGKKGHIASACRSRKAAQSPQEGSLMEDLTDAYSKTLSGSQLGEAVKSQLKAIQKNFKCSQLRRNHLTLSK